MHYGLDIDLETGDAVSAAFEGMVRISQHHDSYGNVVVIRHNNGLETLYAHLSERSVSPGDHVEAGDIIGLGGNTGRSYGSHLHFEIRFLGRPLNPAAVIDFPNETVKSDTLLIASNLFQMPYTPYYGKKRRGSYRRGRSRSSKSKRGRYSYEIRIEEVSSSLYRV